MPRNRHEYETEIRAWLKHNVDDEFPRFDRLAYALGCKTQKEAILKLMDMAEKTLELEKQIKAKDLQIEKLCKDLKQEVQPEEVTILRNKLQNAELQIEKLLKDNREKDSKIDQLEKQIREMSNIQTQPQIREVIREVPKIVEKVIEKPIYIEDDDDWFPFETEEEYKKWLNEF